MERLIVNREPPLHLLILRGAVIVQRILERRKGTFEPAFVQRDPVRIRRLHDQEGTIQLFSEVRPFTQQTAQELQCKEPNRFIRMGCTKKERRAFPMTNGEEFDRSALGGRPDHLKLRKLRELLD